MADELRAKLHDDEKRRGTDLVNRADFMRPTAEATAFAWDALDLEAGIVEVWDPVIRVEDGGDPPGI